MRELNKNEVKLIEHFFEILLAGFVLWLFFAYSAKSQEYDCTITTSGLLHYSTIDNGEHWDRIYEDNFMFTTMEFPIGYNCFMQTIEDTTITYQIQPNSLTFDTTTMHMNFVFCNDWSDECQMDIWFNKSQEDDKGDKLIMKWVEGREINLMIFEIQNWKIVNIPLDLQIKRK